MLANKKQNKDAPKEENKEQVKEIDYSAEKEQKKNETLF